MSSPYREKSHRLPPEFYQGEITVAFTVCVVNSRRLFVDDEVVTAFIGMLSSASAHHYSIVPIYCFMPDHLHVIIQGQKQSSDTRQALIEFKQHSGYWLKRNRSDMRWQKDFYDHMIRLEEDLGVQVRHIAGNPVRNGLAKDWSQYPYTGAIGMDFKSVISSTITL